MLCLRQVCLFALRHYQARTLSSDVLLSQINNCTHEDEVFSLVGRNKARLSEKHVGIALNVLWQLQKKKPLLLRTSDYIRNHSQFLTLCFLAENKVEHMDNEAIVDTLYSILRLNVESHDSLAGVLITEAWKRLESLSLPALSKFALCLHKQRGHFSPLIGKIAHLVDLKLDSIQDIRLLATAALIAEGFNSHQALVILKTMQKMKCRHSHLLEKMVSVLHRHLDSYHVLQLVKLTQCLVLLHCHDQELFGKLKMLLFGFLKSSVIPADTAAIIRTLAMLPSSQVEEIIINKATAVLPQCRLQDISCIATALVKWNHYDTMHWQNTSELHVKLLQKLNDWGFQRLQEARNLNLLLEELTHVNGGWLQEVISEETVAACQRLIDQVTWENVLQLSVFLIKTNYCCPSLLDRIASVTVQNINKIHPLEMYFIVYLFSVLNYDPPANEEFFQSCIQHLTSNLSCFDTHHLVLLGHVLAVAGYFPPAIIKTVFDVSFLSRLNTELEVLSDTLKQRVRSQLMKLNRAVCLECPEFHIPWFHERYFKHVLCKGISRINPLRQHVHRMLAEILGGSHYARVSVLTPYYYEIDFECILDKNKKPLSYMAQNILTDDLREIQLRHDIKNEQREALPQGAQRIALEFLDSKAFSKDSNRLKGEPAVKKRHLEILGYRVIQIPHFEWNSMVLSTKPEQMEYLRKRLYETQ
ncbi:FAST kinase domain-containing protein 1, mitochondrial isoform X2 [Coturnix japonica]|uniref:FAST kinase domain-containing protein 1, mitochondrial isoform X2 n=1 Tax=Coturnix japonica TaxID=93934 RepID=UPI000777AD33|nr:FAST kinase domain-containing protein 1, mitochondrial isoform X2 [Coturnix japonica]